MRKDHYDPSKPQSASSPNDMLKTFSALLNNNRDNSGRNDPAPGGSERSASGRNEPPAGSSGRNAPPSSRLARNDPQSADVPENYNNQKFSKLIRNHDRISREIDRKYNNGKPKE